MKAKIRLKNYINNNITISGAKNSALPIICASILCDEDVTLKNIPNIADVITLINILNYIGITTSFKNNTLTVLKTKKIKTSVTSKKVKNLRGSYYFMGALLGKEGKIKIFYPGGCDLGTRPINYHLTSFKNMNAAIKETNKTITIKGPLFPTNHTLEFPSVGATINIILSSVRLFGHTTINNAATEPEVIDTCNFLNSMGAKIRGIGTKTIHIEGVKYLHGTTYTIISDRIEAGTFLILGALHKGITITNCHPEHLSSLLNILENSGYNITINNKEISLTVQKNIKPFNVTIGPYPSFPTDLGPQLSVLSTQIEGISFFEETIYTNRFSHIEEIKKMGANVFKHDNTIHIQGITPLHETFLEAKDLRQAASLVLAASLSSFFSTIDNIEILFRGYESIQEKLEKLGIEFIILNT